MIYLNPETLPLMPGESFWNWFAREFPSRFGLPRRLREDDVVIQYSTGGFPMAGRSIALLWELYPDMKQTFGSNEWDAKIEKINQAAKFCTFRTVPTTESLGWYHKYGRVDVIPIGVDTNVFRPMYRQERLREKYGIPQDVLVGFWSGTVHPMKGYGFMKEYAILHPEIKWIVNWTRSGEDSKFKGGFNYTDVPQVQLAELMNCADFFLSTGRLKPYFMVEWEAMACNLPFVNLTEREFVPNARPMYDVLDRGWSRSTCKAIWTKYLEDRGVTW